MPVFFYSGVYQSFELGQAACCDAMPRACLQSVFDCFLDIRWISAEVQVLRMRQVFTHITLQQVTVLNQAMQGGEQHPVCWRAQSPDGWAVMV